MDKLELLEKVLKLFSGWKNKAFTAIGKELNDAFSNEVLIQYDRFKHWFIKEDPTAAAVWKKYEEKPEVNEVVVKSIAEDKLAADPAFADTLQRELADLEAKYYNVVNRIGTSTKRRTLPRQSPQRKPQKRARHFLQQAWFTVAGAK